jgi:hypothetical protein
VPCDMPRTQRTRKPEATGLTSWFCADRFALSTARKATSMEMRAHRPGSGDEREDARGRFVVVRCRRPVAAVERKSLPDLVSSLTNGRLRYALGELAGGPGERLARDRPPNGGSGWIRRRVG